MGDTPSATTSDPQSESGGGLSDLSDLCGFCHLQSAEDVSEDVSARQDTSPGGDVQGIQRKLTIRSDDGAELLDESGVGNDVSFRRSAILYSGVEEVS